MKESQMSQKSILLDTDIGPDCDDVAAVALLNIFANAGLCRILGIGHCTSNPYGAGAIDAICTYYGNCSVPIGTYYGPAFLEERSCMTYNRELTLRLKNRYRSMQPENAIEMYRRILAEQPDASVEFIAIGPLNNLSTLLNSPPDSFSSLFGIELVKKKVKHLTAMAGIFRCASSEVCRRAAQIAGSTIEETSEFNVVCDIAAAQNVALNWPTPKTYLGFEAGLIETGGALQKHPDPNHPVRLAYSLFTESGKRYSWDPLTVEHAVCSNCSHFSRSRPGTVCFDGQGRTHWAEDKNGHDCYLELAQEPKMVERDIDAVLMNELRS